MARFKFLESKITLLNIATAVFMLSFAFFAPTNFFVENGPIETLESFALLVGAAFCFIEYRKNRNFKHFFALIGILLVLFVGRELNWGRVFFTDEVGNIVKRRDWVFGPYIYYILAPIFLAVLAYAIKTKFVQNAIILLRKAPIMTLDFALVVVMMFISNWAESSSFPASIASFNFAVEESAEVAMYIAVAFIISTYSRKNLLANIEDKK